MFTDQALQNAFAKVALNHRTKVSNQTRLLQNYPNPFNPETWFPFALSQEVGVTIRIYDLRGQQIRQLDFGQQLAGH